MNEIKDIISKYMRFATTYRGEVQNLINSALPEIKNSFVNIYGEENREEINKRFANIEIIVSPFNMMSICSCAGEEIVEFLKKKYPDEEIFSGLYTYSFNPELNKELDEIRVLMEPLKELESQYSKSEQYIRDKVMAEELPKFLSFVREVLGNEVGYDADIINKIINKLVANPLDIQKINVFCSQNNTNNWLYMSQLVDGYNFLGIDVGNLICISKNLTDYTSEDFIADKNVLASLLLDDNVNRMVIPSESVHKIISYFNCFTKTVNNRVDAELYNEFFGIPPLGENLIGFSGIGSLFNYIGGYCEPCLIKNSIHSEVGSVVVINPYSIELSQIGGVLIHEINHALESYYDYSLENVYYLRSGWDTYGRNLGDHTRVEQVGEYRNLELFNEVINEKITLDVLNDLKFMSSNVIFSEYFGCLYNNAFFACDDFYNFYKEIIKKSRFSYDINILFDNIGKESFDKLTELFMLISEKVYSGDFVYEDVLKDFNAGIKTENTDFLGFVLSQVETILNQIKQNESLNVKTRGSINFYQILLLFSMIIVLFILMFFCL